MYAKEIKGDDGIVYIAESLSDIAEKVIRISEGHIHILSNTYDSERDDLALKFKEPWNQRFNGLKDILLVSVSATVYPL